MVDFRIDVVIDPRNATDGSRTVEKELTRVENRADSLQRSLLGAFAVFGGAAVLRQGLTTLASFEQSLATVRAVTGATADQFAQLRDRAKELGISTRFTATQAGDALLNLARAGFSVNESLKAVGGTLLLAQAGGLDLATASDIAASTLRGFRLQAEQTDRVVDVLALTANSANTNVGQLGEGLKFVAPIAAGLGVSLETTNAALGTLSDAGLKATLAGTGLRRVLAELEAPSETSRAILKELGVTADEVRVSQVGLVTALERLRDAGLDTGTALEFFGQRGGPAFEVLSNQIPRLKELTASLQNAGGVAKRTADVIDDNLNGAVLRAKSALEGLVLSLGDAGATNALTRTFENITLSLRFLAENAVTTGSALTTLGSVITLRLIPGLSGIATAAVSANPVLAALAATATVVAIAYGKLADEFAVVDQNLKQLEQDAKFASLGAQIRVAQQELNRLNEAATRSPLGEQQAAQVQRLTQRIAEYRAQIRGEADDAAKVRAAQEAQNASAENSLSVLDRRIRALQDLSRETVIQAQLEDQVNQLLAAGIVPTAADRTALEAKLRLVDSLQAQRDALEEIRGPQEEVARKQAALNELLAGGRITVEEFNAATAQLKATLDEALGSDPFEGSLQSLRDSIELQRAQLQQGEIASQAIAIEQELRAQGVMLTREQQDALAELLIQQDELNKKLERQNEVKREAERDAQKLERLAAEIDLNAQLAEQEAQLLLLRQQRPDLENEIAVALENVQLRSLEASTTLEAGFTRAFLKLKREAEDFAAVAEQAVGVLADKATDALVEFATTGKFAFKDFASSILKELTRVIARLLIVKALQAAVGALGGDGSSVANDVSGAAASSTDTALAGARADGGTVQPNRSYLVGENGPELFRPGQTGTIVPNGGEQAAPPQVNVQVVNVTDPNEVPKAISSGQSDEAIINALQRNPDRVKQVVQ